jgi:1,4-dihydroxy-2-naphthoate octaprenyltransferase
MTLARSTIQLLRFHFSFFLLPVFLFACSTVPSLHVPHALLAFFILHLLVYPASNGYNSYMDRDETPIGGLRDPLQPTRQLFYVTLVMDTMAVLLGALISYWFAAGILVYVLVSRAYSYRGIRLKKYPYIGYLTVVIFQGAFSYALCCHAASADQSFQVPVLPALISSLLIGGFYPLTQIYQHEADLKDGVVTISYRLGYRGSFIFTAALYLLAMAFMWLYFRSINSPEKFALVSFLMLPVLLVFLSWARAVWQDNSAASFSNTMRMNIVASVCTNLAFLVLLIWRYFE